MDTVTGRKNLDLPVYRDIREMLQGSIRRYPDLPAYSFRGEPRSVVINKTYQELADDIDDFGEGILALGHEPWQEHVSVIGENSYPWVVSHTACLFGLGIAVPLDKLLEYEELESLVERGGVTVLVADKKQLEKIERLARAFKQIKRIVIMDDKQYVTKKATSDPRYIAFEDVLALGKEAKAKGDSRFASLTIEPEKTAAILFTSGTTERAKGVMLSHHNIISNINQGIETIALQRGGRALSILPLHHTLESTVGMYCLWTGGVCICINDGLRYLKSNIVDWKITMIIVVPVMLEKIYRQIMLAIQKQGKERTVRLMRRVTRILRRLGIDIRRKVFKNIHDTFGGELRYLVSGAAPLSVEIHNFFNEIGFECWTGYGLTETAPMLASSCQAVNVPGAVGRALSGISLKIDRNVSGGADDQTGEILAKGDNVMLGYYQDAVATAKAFDRDGWLRTGDVGYLDRNECLFITGRAKSMILLSNGKNIFPEELEFLLESIPGVIRSLVWGEPGVRDQIDICARIQVDPEQLPDELKGKDEGAISSWLREKIDQINHTMPMFKSIRYFIWNRQDMIVTTTLKVKRAEETARIEAELARRELSLKDLKDHYFSFDPQ